MSIQHVLLEEVARLLARGQSVVIYHHLGRNGLAANQIQRWAARLAALGFEQPLAVRYRRGSARAFFIVPSPTHRRLLDDRLHGLLMTPWSRHFTAAIGL